VTTRQPQPWTPERHAALKALDAAATPGPFVEVNRGEITEADPARRVARDPHLGETLAQVAGNLHIRDAEALARFFAAARDDVPDMLAKIEALTSEVEFYKRRERDICAAVGGVGNGGRYRNDIICALRNRLRPEGPLTKETKAAIRKHALDLCGSGVPEEGLAYMLADHAIGLLENQRPEWFGKAKQ
jgi:hypothetical protein